MVVLPEPCPPAKPIIKGLFFLAFLEIQKQIGIRKDLIIRSLFLNFSPLVSWEEIYLKETAFTLEKHSSTDRIN